MPKPLARPVQRSPVPLGVLGEVLLPETAQSPPPVPLKLNVPTAPTDVLLTTIRPTGVLWNCIRNSVDPTGIVKTKQRLRSLSEPTGVNTGGFWLKPCGRGVGISVTPPSGRYQPAGIFTSQATACTPAGKNGSAVVGMVT